MPFSFRLIVKIGILAYPQHQTSDNVQPLMPQSVYVQEGRLSKEAHFCDVGRKNATDYFGAYVIGRFFATFRNRCYNPNGDKKLYVIKSLAVGKRWLLESGAA